MFANPNRDAAVVVVFVNYDRDPPPTPAECWRLGALLERFVAQRPQDERVAIVAAGGLSHWVGYEDASINEAFDKRFLKRWNVAISRPGARGMPPISAAKPATAVWKS